MSEFNKRYLDFCKPFIMAVKDVYSMMVMVDITPGTPGFKENANNQTAYCAIMGMNGKFEKEGSEARSFRGNLVLAWPIETYLKTAGGMLGEEYTEINDEIADVGMEICNITMGNAKKILAEEGYKIEMSTPTSVNGSNYEIKSQSGTSTIVTPFKSDIGEFYIELNYEDS